MVSGWERNPNILGQMRAANRPSPLPFVNRSTPFTNPPRQLEPTAAQLDTQAQQRLRDQYGNNDMFGARATEQPTMTRQEAVQGLRQTAVGARNLFTPYVEANLSRNAFSEGRIAPGVGWGALAVAGSIPFAKPAAKGLGRLGRALRTEREVARGRRELRGGNNRFLDTVEGRFGGQRQEMSPFSYHLDEMAREEVTRNRRNFWGDSPLWPGEEDRIIRAMLDDYGWNNLSGDQQWSRFFDRHLRSGPRPVNRYNPEPGAPIRAGGDNIDPLYWKPSGGPIRADGIEILPWERYEALRPIEMRRYADPFFNSPVFNQGPAIDITRRRGW